MTDAQSLAEFSRTKSPAAFSAIVQQHIDLVYATARRLVGDVHLAEDVTQAAFIVLVRRAEQVNPQTLAGWLVNTTRLTAKEAIRSKLIRDKHEAQAASVRAETSAAAGSSPADDATANELLPLLDEALSQLSEADRTAVVLRFLQGQTFVEVGQATGTTEEAARKRVGRAVEKLRAIFMKQGVVASAGGLMLVLAAEQAKAAPAGVAVAATAAAGSGGSATSALLAKGVSSMMTWAKLKAAAIVAAVLLATGTVGVGVEMARLSKADPPAAAVPPPPVVAPAATTFKATLKNGVSIELIGLSENPSAGKPWWTADGSPLAVRPYAKAYDTSYAPAGSVAREMAFRTITDLPGLDGPATLNCFTGSGSSVEDEDGQTIPGITSYARSVHDQPTVIRFTVAAGPWMTRADMAIDQSAFGNSTSTRGGKAVLFSQVTNSRGQRVISAADNYTDEDMRFVAIDSAGKRWPLGTQGGSSVSSIRQSVAVAEVTPKQMIQRIEFQTRPHDQWIEFRNVSLHPGEKTAVQIATSDDAAPLTDMKAAILGSWRVDGIRVEGKAQPNLGNRRFIFEAGKVHATQYSGEEVGDYVIDTTHTPAWIDFGNPTKKGLIELKDGRLRFMMGDVNTRPTTLESLAGEPPYQLLFAMSRELPAGPIAVPPITVHIKNATPQEALTAISKAVGSSVESWPPTAWEATFWQGGAAALPKVTIDQDNQPFWVIMRDFCLQAKARPDMVGGRSEKTLTVMQTEVPFFTGPSYVGSSYAVEVAGLTRAYMTSFQQKQPAAMKSCNMNLDGWFDPRVPVIKSAWGVRVDQAVDENGVSVAAPANPGDDSMNRPAFSAAKWSAGNVPLDYDPARSKMLKHFAGHIHVEIATGEETVDFGEVASTKGKSAKTAGVIVTVDEAAATPSSANVALTIAADPAASAGGAGALKDHDLAKIYFVGAKGDEMESSGQWENKGGGAFEVQAGLNFGGQEGPLHLVLKLAAGSKTVDVPFEFNDVPLP